MPLRHPDLRIRVARQLNPLAQRRLSRHQPHRPSRPLRPLQEPHHGPPPPPHHLPQHGPRHLRQHLPVPAHLGHHPILQRPPLHPLHPLVHHALAHTHLQNQLVLWVRRPIQTQLLVRSESLKQHQHWRELWVQHGGEFRGNIQAVGVKRQAYLQGRSRQQNRREQAESAGAFAGREQC